MDRRHIFDLNTTPETTSSKRQFDLNVTPEMMTMSGEKQLFDLNSTPYMSEEENTHNHLQKRKRLDDQAKEVLEAFFKECTHPKKRQREELSRQLGIEVQHLQYWFQNKRTQMSSQNRRQVNSKLQREIEELRLEITRYTEALRNPCCTTRAASRRGISYEEHRLRMENTRLEEIAKYGEPLPLLKSGEASSSVARSQQQPPSTTPQNPI